MAKNKTKDIIITAALAVLLLFFAVIACFQIYESVRINDEDERIVLGVGSTSDGDFHATLKGKPLPVGDYIAIVSGGNFTVVDKNAAIKTEGNFMLSDPIMHSKGKYLVAADYKGKTARLYEEGKLKTEIKCEGRIISVVVNTNGFFAVATEETGYNAVINVYHKGGEAIYRYRISENRFIDMDISANNRKLIVAEANTSAAAPGSTVVLAEFNRDRAENSFFAESNIYVGVHFNKNGSFVCIGNSGIDFYRSDCAKVNEIKFGSRTLKHGDIMTDDMVALAFDGADDAPVGSSVLEIYDKKGNIRGSIAFDSEIEDISVNGGFVGVAHGETFDIVKSNGKIKKTFESTSPIKYAIPFKGGNCALIFAGGNTTIVR